MKELVFALEFRGSAAPVAGSDKKLQARTSAVSQTLRSVLKPDGIQGSIETSTGGASASFESEVEMVGEGAFVESGSIRYGDAGRVSFRTVGRGTLGASPHAGLQRGAVMWEVTGARARSRARKASSPRTSRSARRAKWWTTTSRGSSCHNRRHRPTTPRTRDLYLW